MRALLGRARCDRPAQSGCPAEASGAVVCAAAAPDVLAPTTPPATPPALVGFVDRVETGVVRGWAAFRPDLSSRVRVRLYLDDALVAEGVAAEERHDVRDAGYGDGAHGFALPVPKRALLCAETLALAACGDGGAESVLQRIVLRERVARLMPTLYMDASDLVEFLGRHRELSGIQRVQAAYLRSFGEATIAGTRLRICARLRSSPFFQEVPHGPFVRLLDEAGDLSAVPEHAWADHVASFRKALTVRAVPIEGDTIFTLGAPWALDDHNAVIRCAKSSDGVHYLQIFYDLIPLTLPEVVPAPLIPTFTRALAATALFADHVFAISDHSRREFAALAERIGRPVPDTSVVPMGGTVVEAAELASEAAAETLEGLGSFVLCVGTLEPRKNHRLLFEVWRRLVARHGRDAVPKLVLVGRVGWYMEDFMRQLEVTGFLDGTVVHLQGTTNLALSRLYDDCLFTVFPSVSEGWGLPITESLSRGKVCVCSEATAMPEAGGEHALYIDPFDVTGAFDTIERLLFDGESLARETAKVASFHPFTWDQASEALRARLAEVLPRLAAKRTGTPKAIVLGRTYRFFDLATDGSPNVSLSDFVEQEDALDLLVGEAWFDLDVRCTWACGARARIALPLPEDVGRDHVVYFGLVVPPAYAGVPCEVLLDGVPCGRLEAPSGPTEIQLAVPRSDAPERVVLFRFLGARRPSSDLRLLGIGIATVAVFARSDVERRLAFFEARAIRPLSPGRGTSLPGRTGAERR